MSNHTNNNNNRTNNAKRIIADSSDDDDGTPIAKRSKSNSQINQINSSKPIKNNQIITSQPQQADSFSGGNSSGENSSSEDDVPIAQKQSLLPPQQAERVKASNGSIDGTTSSSITTLTNNSIPKSNHQNKDEQDSDLSSALEEPLIKTLPKFKKNVNANTRGPSTSKAQKLSKDVEEDSDEEKPLVEQTRKTNKKPRLSKSASVKPKVEDSDSEEETPIASIQKSNTSKPASSNAKTKRKANSSKKSKPDSSSDSESTKPKKKLVKPNKKTKPKDSDSELDIPIADKKPIKAKAKANPKSTASAATTAPDAKPKLNKRGSKATTKKQEEEEKVAGSDEDAEDEEYKWWEQTKDDDTKKWDTLQHNGVLFPPPYVPLPKHVKMLYDGKKVDLPPEAEEVAGFFGSMLNSDHVQKPTFCQNFFNDFLEVLESHPPRDGTKITDFSKCNFEPIQEHYDLEREKKKSLSKEEKAKLKKEKEELEKNFQFCLLDGRQEKVGNFRVEPPSLFRGRGEHPKTGRLKKRIYAEDITINCSKDAPIPVPPPGHNWGSIVHLDSASWLAMWKENINGAFKYVFLAPGSSLKGQSDMKKFEKARLLKGCIEKIRRDYREQLSDKVMAIRQRATAMYLIDVLALRAGNEKGDDEADTVGCCSLRYEHLTLEPPSTVTFDFLGKDSIRFFNTVQVDVAVFKNLKIFKKEPKTVGDMIFDRLTTASLNKHLSDYMAGLTAKVFRTYNASFTFERELEKNMKELVNPTLADKIYAYNKANREVAVLCNHQKSVSKGHDASMEKAYDKIRAMKYQRRRLRYQVLNSEEYDKKSHKMYQVDESDVDDEWMDAHEIDLGLKEQEKVVKKFERENLALEKDEKPTMGKDELEERLKDVEGFATVLKKERKSKKVGSVKSRPIDQLINAIEKLDQRIEAAKTACKDRDEGKETSLGTSKMNYIDPRLTYAWCRRNDVPVERMFTKTLREKFTWAAGTPPDWKF